LSDKWQWWWFFCSCSFQFRGRVWTSEGRRRPTTLKVCRWSQAITRQQVRGTWRSLRGPAIDRNKTSSKTHSAKTMKNTVCVSPYKIDNYKLKKILLNWTQRHSFKVMGRKQEYCKSWENILTFSYHWGRS